MLATAQDTLNGFFGIGAAVGGIGYMLGQFFSSRKKGTGESLNIALNEVAAVKTKADRLEKDVVALQGQVHALEKENITLREVLATRDQLDGRLIQRVEQALADQTQKLIAVMREARN